MGYAEHLHEWWKHPQCAHLPHNYAEADPARSEYLAGLVRSLMKRPQSILEVGCNAGRNLNTLMNYGYDNLVGIDVNTCAETMKKYFPSLRGHFWWGPAEVVLPTIADNSFDLVFTMAVLMHISPTTIDAVASDMVRITNCAIITIEDEECCSPGHQWNRDYYELFVSLGMTQIFGHGNLNVDKDVDEHFVARIFVKN